MLHCRPQSAQWKAGTSCANTIQPTLQTQSPEATIPLSLTTHNQRRVNIGHSVSPFIGISLSRTCQRTSLFLSFFFPPLPLAPREIRIPQDIVGGHNEGIMPMEPIYIVSRLLTKSWGQGPVCPVPRLGEASPCCFSLLLQT